MEPIFENVTVETEALIQKAFNNLQSKNYLHTFIIFGLGLMLALALYLWQREEVWLLLAAVYIGFLIRRAYQFATYGKNSLRRRLAYYDGGNPPMTNRFYGDHLVAQDVDSMNITPYCKLKKVEYNGELLLLYRKDGMLITLDARGFTKGDGASCYRFLQNQIQPYLPAAQR